MSGGPDDSRPLLRVIAGGDPTDEEVAALVAAFAVVAARAAPELGSAGGSRWASRQQALRRPLHPGPGAWRASARRH
jgi:hypothetical protein